MSPSHLGDFFWFRFARPSCLFFGAGLAFALAALTLVGLRIDLFGGIRPAPFTSFQGFLPPLSGGLGSSWPNSSPDAFFVRGS